tara:strand:+ start:465 stop:1517 length:1053 start_codon:yes stop_codon:yes gene_type:complete
MIKIETYITVPNSKFRFKKDWKDYTVSNFVPEDTDPLRIYNFKLMKKYGEGFFYLKFVPPNIGVLNHIYQTEEEYEKSIPLRIEQKKLFESNNIIYEISEPYEIHDKVLTKEQYYNLHTDNLIPLDIKIDVDYFLLEMDKYNDQFFRWGDKYKEYPRYAIPLINLNGKLDNDSEPACYPLDRWNFLQSDLEDTAENFTDFMFNTSHFEKGLNLFETDFTKSTELMNLGSLKPLDRIKKYMVRSCILKWHSMGHFNPHFDTWHPTKWLRLWGTTHPEKMKLRYKVGDNGYVENKLTNKFEKYAPVQDVQAGRLYLHDSLKWHDAFAFDDNVYQFFIALNVDSYDCIEELKI